MDDLLDAFGQFRRFNADGEPVAREQNVADLGIGRTTRHDPLTIPQGNPRRLPRVRALVDVHGWEPSVCIVCIGCTVQCRQGGLPFGQPHGKPPENLMAEPAGFRLELVRVDLVHCILVTVLKAALRHGLEDDCIRPMLATGNAWLTDPDGYP